MAWGGKHSTRMTEKQRVRFFSTSNRRLPMKENPHGIPRAIQKQLALENLPSDPVKWNARLQALLSAYKQNGG